MLMPWALRPPGDNGTFWTDGVSVVSPDSQLETDVDMNEMKNKVNGRKIILHTDKPTAAEHKWIFFLYSWLPTTWWASSIKRKIHTYASESSLKVKKVTESCEPWTLAVSICWYFIDFHTLCSACCSNKSTYDVCETHWRFLFSRRWYLESVYPKIIQPQYEKLWPRV